MIFKKNNTQDDGKTRRIDPQDGEGWHAATRKISDADDSDKTQLLEDTEVTTGQGESSAPSSNDQNKTTLYRGEGASEEGASEQELPVGWLIVIDGPGKGASFQLGYGHNAIGRDADQRISIDLGDTSISRQRHAAVTYDGKNRKFYISHGEGDNLVYLNEAPVLEPKSLSAYDKFTIGQTTLLLLPLCNDSFDWE